MTNPNSSWLLRLFESQFFDSRLAIYYLHSYPEKVGVQHYICQKLDEFSVDDIIFLLPQLCHLLLSLPSKRPALEEFILRQCRGNEHIETLTIWILQSYLSDLKINKKRAMLQYCERVYTKLQRQAQEVGSGFDYVKVSNSLPILIGIGSMMASVASAQTHDEIKDMLLLESKRSIIRTPGTSAQSSSASLNLSGISLPVPSAPTVEQLSKGNAFSSTSYVHAQLAFVKALTAIGDRLLSVPREGRQSSLVAEIGLVNNNLPAQVCIPLWCKGKEHHRILRISTMDAVVLNSADRVPFLIYVEIADAGVSEEDIIKARSRTPTVSKESSRPSVLAPPPFAVTVDSRSARLATTTINSGNTTPTSSPESPELLGTEHLARDRVLERRLSVLEPRNVALLESINDRLRTASILLAQLYQEQQRQTKPQTGVDFENIRNRIVKEMMHLEEERVKHAKNSGNPDLVNDDVLNEEQERMLRDVAVTQKSDDPSAAVFRESWLMKKERIRLNSPYGTMPKWDLVSVIVKGGADLRQEELALQLIGEMKRIWKEARMDVRVY